MNQITELEVLAPGPLATVQDLGRPGYADLGVSPSGACDRAALRMANRLAGNPENAAAIELTFGGLSVRASRQVVAVLGGAPAPMNVNGKPAALYEPVLVPPRSVLAVGAPAVGVRSYLAIHGGLDVPQVLGSRSTDLLSGLGPRPLARGDRLPVGASTGPIPAAAAVPVSNPASELWVGVLLGPRDDWFTTDAAERLITAQWRVSDQCNRIGIRLSGPHLDRSRGGELQSEGILRGAVQVPSSGQPLIFLADHPTTGGYPVIAVVVSQDVDRLAQAPPGQILRFRPVPL